MNRFYHSYLKDWRKRNPEKVREHALRAKAKLYGLTLEQYKELLAKTDGCCSICGDRPKSSKNLHIDHDHKTSVVRGLLCMKCNVGLRAFREDPELMLKAMWYLRGILPDELLDSIAKARA